MRIETMILEALFKKVIAKLRELEIDHVDLHQDYYLLISNGDWTKVDEDNPEPVTGSLVDDWQSLNRVASGENPMMFVDFDRLASILRAMSEELNPES